MKGQNSIKMNQATIMEAIQEYLDSRWKGTTLEVTAVAGRDAGESEGAA